MMWSLGLIGYGAFGRLCAQSLSRYVPLQVYETDEARRKSASFGNVAFVELGQAASSDVVLICVPIRQFRETVSSIVPFLKRGALVADVCSVKTLPVTILQTELPDYVDVMCTHPLFGPQSAKDGIAGLKIVVCHTRGRRCEIALRFLRERLSLEVIRASSERHDQEMAVVQGLTHLIAKVLTRMEPLPTEMVTRSFEYLLKATDYVRHDSDELFRAIEQDNPFAQEVTERFFRLATELYRDLKQRPSAKLDANAIIKEESRVE